MKSFQFTLSNGSVTGVTATNGDRTQTLRIPTDATSATAQLDSALIALL